MFLFWRLEIVDAPTPSHLPLVFRPVRLDDKPRVLEFTVRTWDDGDYITDVFDEWLADPTGRFTAIELDGQVVAIGKLTDLGEGELWLEGLRVDPAHRRKGIGEALHAFNLRWGRRVLSGGAVVLLISDGWDRGDPALLGEEMGRLQRSCHRLVWLNPLMGAPDYEPLTRGLQAALPFVDDFLPVHHLANLADLARHLERLPPRRAARGRPGFSPGEPAKGMASVARRPS